LKSAEWHLKRCKPTCPHFFVPCSGLDLSHPCAQSLLCLSDFLTCLQAVTAGMSLELMYLVDPDSADKQAILVGGEAVILLKALLRFCPSAARKDFSCMQIWRSRKLCFPPGVQKSVFSPTSCCRLLDLFHLCHGHVAWACVGGMHETLCSHPNTVACACVWVCVGGMHETLCLHPSTMLPT
jgi:hypothetical protein